MRAIGIVFGYTFREHLKKRSFIISTAILLLLTVALMLVPAAITHFSGDSTPEPGQPSQPTQQEEPEGTLYVADQEALLGDAAASLSAALPDYRVEAVGPERIEPLSKEIAENDKAYLLVLSTGQNDVIQLEYFYKTMGSGPSPDTLSAIVKGLYDGRLLTEAGVPQPVMDKLAMPVSLVSNEMGKGFLQSTVFSFVVMLLLFFAIYFYGYWIAMSVASEKTSRVMEMLLTSTKPSSIIIGKTLAMGALGLCQLLSLMVVGFVTFSLAFPADFTVLGQSLDLSMITPYSVFVVLLYFVLGYLLYAAINAVAGATVSKAEDVNSALTPISMISLAAFYFGYMTAAIPGGGKLSVIASLVPFSAPFSMPGRVMASDVPVWQLLVSVALLIVLIVLLAALSIRLYSSAVLHYGKRLKISELMKMSGK